MYQFQRDELDVYKFVKLKDKIIEKIPKLKVDFIIDFFCYKKFYQTNKVNIISINKFNV